MVKYITSDQQDILDQQKDWLEENLANYRMAQEILSDLESMHGMLKGLRVKLEPIFRYDPETHPPHSAVYVVGCIKERIAGLFSDLEFIEEYEDKKKEYHDTVKAYALDEDDDETETTE